MENPEIYNPESLINYSEGYTEGPNLEEIPADAEIIPDAPEEDTWKPAQMYKVKDYPIVKRIINKTLPDYKEPPTK